jgi:branched-chain amino acid transport system ATP-binding protein
VKIRLIRDNPCAILTRFHNRPADRSWTLLFDEPSEGLAPLIVAEIGRIIVDLKQEGFSILLVEQHLPMAMAVAAKVYVMNKGQLVFEGNPQTLQADEELKHKYLGV